MAEKARRSERAMEALVEFGDTCDAWEMIDMQLCECRGGVVKQ